jgi:hypothetical protein
VRESLDGSCRRVEDDGEELCDLPRSAAPLPSRRDQLPMESSAPARVLVVANRTAATPALQNAVRERAAAGPAIFTLLVPNSAHGLHRVTHPEDNDRAEAGAMLELALPLLEEAAGSEIDGIIGDHNPFDAIQDAINMRGADEIILSTLPTRVSRWLHSDLPSKLNALGLPVTTITAAGTRRAIPKREEVNAGGAAA